MSRPDPAPARVGALVPAARAAHARGAAPAPAARVHDVAPELPPVPHPPTRSDSFDALFAPAAALVSPVPFSFHLLELVRPLLYPDPAAHFARYDLRYDNGLGVEVELHGHGELGLPTVYDYDVLFALFRLAADREVTASGELRGVSFRDIARTMGGADEDYGGRVHAQIKESLNRWAALKFATNFDFTQARRAAEARDGRARAHTPDALPRRVRPKKQWYFVVQHGVYEGADAAADVAADVAADATERAPAREFLGVVRFDSVWLDGIASGSTAWVDLDLHAGIAERYAKRLYEVLLVRALRHPTWGPHEPWTISVTGLLDELGVRDQRKRSRDTVIAKLPMLQELGVLGAWRERPGRGDRHLLELEPGERLCAARAYVGVRMHERPEIARLVWALQQSPWGFSLTEARHMADTRPAVALRVLQRAVYLLETGWRPGKSWGGWLKDALVEEYAFGSDARYQAWLDVRLRGHQVPAFVDVRYLPAGTADRLRGEAGLPVALPLPGAAPDTVSPAAARLATAGVRPPAAADDPSPAEAVEHFEDDVWGRVRRQLGAELPPALYATWIAPLRPAQLATADVPTLVLVAPDDFAAEWVSRGYAPRIAELAGAELGVAVAAVVRTPAAAARAGTGRDG